jgi:hypothetical protein
MYYKVKVSPNNYIKAEQITSDGYVKFYDTDTAWLYTKGEAQKKAGIFGGKIEAVDYTKSIKTVTTTQIPNNLISYAVKSLLKGREAFNDNTTNNEIIYQGDVFRTILSEINETKFRIFRPTNEIMNQLRELSQIVTTDYIQITTS